MKNSALLLVLLFTLNMFGQSNKTWEIFNEGYSFEKQNRILDSIFENGVLNKDIFEFWRLDSIVIYNVIDETDSVAFNKNIITYYNSNNTAEYIYLYKNPDGEEWENKAKNVLSFNENGQQTQSIFYQGVNQEWILWGKTDYTYNNENRVAIKTRFEWDSNNNLWLNGHKTELEYNEFGSIICELHYKPDNETNNWQFFYKYDFVFNMSDFLEKKITSFWDSQASVWDFSYKKVFTQEDGVNSDYSYNWDSIDWSPVSKNIGYRIDSYTIAHNGYTFSDSVAWVNDKRSETRYDIDGNLTLYESFYYNSSNNTWVGYLKYNNIYNESGQHIMNINYDWRTANDGWVISYKEQYGYNDKGLRYYYGTFGWLESEKIWIKNWSLISFYSNPSSITDYSTNYSLIQIYPNPCTNKITINYDTIVNQNAVYSIFTISGKVIVEGVTAQSNTINVSKLDAGYYLIKLEVGVKRYSGKFFKL